MALTPPDPPRRVVDLAVSEAFDLLAPLGRFDLPPLDALENEDWGRDWLLSRFLELSPAELRAMGLVWDEPAG